MLALTRRLHEVIELAIPGRTKRIKLKILRIGVNRVKLGIEAEREIEILRPDYPDANRRSFNASA